MSAFRAYLAATLMLSGAAYADTQALHTRAWYVARDDQRLATLHWCGEDNVRQDMIDCQRAQAAANIVRARRGGDPLATWDRSQWWADNPQARAGILRICEHPDDPGAAMYLRYCRSAQTAQTYGGWQGK